MRLEWTIFCQCMYVRVCFCFCGHVRRITDELSDDNHHHYYRHHCVSKKGWKKEKRRKLLPYFVHIKLLWNCSCSSSIYLVYIVYVFIFISHDDEEDELTSASRVNPCGGNGVHYERKTTRQDEEERKNNIKAYFPHLTVFSSLFVSIPFFQNLLDKERKKRKTDQGQGLVITDFCFDSDQSRLNLDHPIPCPHLIDLYFDPNVKNKSKTRNRVFFLFRFISSICSKCHLCRTLLLPPIFV